MKPHNSIGEQIKQARTKLRKEGRKFTGLRVLWAQGGFDTIPAGSWMIAESVKNLDKQNPACFEVFTNGNNEVAIRQTAWVANFNLV